MSLTKPLIFERDDKLYIVGPVAPVNLAENELEELAFSKELRSFAPNQLLGWLRGDYVEADRPNRNGALWTGDELAIKSLTPRLMPVTVMHDPRTAVGMIADTQLLTPEAAKVPRAKISSTLGIWRHRFPEAWEEAEANYRQGSLMQSMECLKEWYECGSCGVRYPALPDGAEKINWCEHLRGEAASTENAIPVRRLGNVTFTGTGLIFGTRGAQGAYSDAHLDVLQEEVAEFHERARRDSTSKPKPRRQHRMEIEDRDYQQLLADRAERDRLKAELDEAQEKAAKVPDLEKAVETAEAAKTKAETEREDLAKKVKDAEEKAQADALKDDRLGKLGKGFKEKLGDFTRGRLEEQAAELSDEQWDNRLKELEEMAGVKRDEGEPEGGSGESASSTGGREETARMGAGGDGGTGGGNNGGTGGGTTPSQRSVIGGLARSVTGGGKKQD